MRINSVPKKTEEYPDIHILIEMTKKALLQFLDSLTFLARLFCQQINDLKIWGKITAKKHITDVKN